MRTTVVTMIVLLVGLYFWFVALQHGQLAPSLSVFFGIIVVFALVVPLILVQAGLMLTKISFDHGAVCRHTFGGSKSYPLNEIAKVQRLSVQVAGPPNKVTVILTPSGKSLFTVTMAFWSESDFESFWNWIGVPVSGSYSDVIPFASLATLYPPVE